MPARNYNIILDQGADYVLAIPVLDPAADPVPLTGWTVSGQVRPQYTSVTAAYALDLSIEGSEVILRIPANISSGWKWRSARYDVELVSPDGLNHSRLIQGSIVLRPEVTR